MKPNGLREGINLYNDLANKIHSENAGELVVFFFTELSSGSRRKRDWLKSFSSTRLHGNLGCSMQDCEFRTYFLNRCLRVRLSWAHALAAR